MQKLVTTDDLDGDEGVLQENHQQSQIQTNQFKSIFKSIPVTGTEPGNSFVLFVIAFFPATAFADLPLFGPQPEQFLTPTVLHELYSQKGHPPNQGLKYLARLVTWSRLLGH